MTIRGFALSVASVFLLLVMLQPRAHAAYVINVTEVGSDVVATGSGSLDLTDLGSPGSAGWSGMFIGTGAGAWVGSAGNVDVYYGFSGPTSFGTQGGQTATSDSGAVTGIFGAGDAIDVPRGYVSGTDLAGSSTWANATIESLGLIAGSYVWTWGSGAHADSFTVNILDVPEPATIAVLGIPLAVMLLNRRRAG